MAGQNTLIVYTDYNNIQTAIAAILGTGTGDKGYGQTVSSSQVSQYAKISVTEWNNLRTDILKARQHQTSAVLVLTQPTTAVKITEADRAAYAAMAADAETNRLAAPPPTDATREDLVTSSTKAPGWNGSISYTVTVDFSSAEAARFYFNTGSRIEFSASLTGGTSATAGTKDNSWAAIFTGMGTVYFNRSNTTCTGTGTTTAIGWAGLTTSNQVIFTKSVSGTTYVPNQYQIQARAPSSTQIVFTITFSDSSGQPNPPWGTDENVTGTLVSYVQVYRASGSNVSVNKPTGTKTTL